MRYFFIAFLLAPFLAVAGATSLSSQIDVTATTTSTLALDGNSKRNYLLIQNHGTVAVGVKFTASHGGGETLIQVPASEGSIVFESMVPRGSVYVKAASGSQAISILEGISP